MEIEIEKCGDVFVIQVPGKSLDAANAKAFRQAIQELLHDETRIVFDLGRVSFMDSSGLGVLLTCHRQLDGKGGALKLCNMVSPVESLFKLVRMDRVFDVHATREESIAAF